MNQLTSNQQHCLATPRRGNLVHKLTANFRDPMQLRDAYDARIYSDRTPTLFHVYVTNELARLLSEPATPANTPEI